MPSQCRYDAVVFDLLTALIDSWSLWNEIAGSPEAGLAWRKAYLRLTYDCGPYRPYEDLVREAAASTDTPTSCADELSRRWGELKPWDDVQEVLEPLSKKVPLAVVTNNSKALAKVAADRVGVTFKVVVTAEEAGFYKPRPEPYLAVLEQLGTRPERTLFVAGSSADVPGASGVGMPVMWHNRIGLPFLPGGARPLLVSDRLRPLTQLVTG
jgi:2-haloalkanoic acid dehalogenase type II